MVLWIDIAKLGWGGCEKGAIMQKAEKKRLGSRHEKSPAGKLGGTDVCVRQCWEDIFTSSTYYIIEVLETWFLSFGVECADGNTVPRFFAEHVSDAFTLCVDAFGVNLVSLD